jgi:putative ABC transport system permease protein
MIRVALKGIATRKLRSLLTALAVVLGVALISGTYILTDSIEKAFGSILASSYDETDAVVTGPDLHGAGASAVGVPGADGIVSAALLQRIRALPEVEEAAGTLIDFSRGADPATLVDSSGKPVKRRGPTYAFGIEPDAERFNPLELVDGRWSAGGGDVVIDAETAARHDYSIGDRIGVTTLGPIERFTSASPSFAMSTRSAARRSCSSMSRRRSVSTARTASTRSPSRRETASRRRSWSLRSGQFSRRALRCAPATGRRRRMRRRPRS